MANNKWSGDTVNKKLRLKKQRERKTERLRKKLERKREKKREELRKSDPEINHLVLNCKTKRGFPDRQTALRFKPQDLDIYECDICLGWHFTKRRKQKSA